MSLQQASYTPSFGGLGLREYIEYGGRSTGKPLSYSAVENTFYQFFIYRQVLTTPFNYRFQEGANPRQLEIAQTVRLMNIVADEIYINQFDPARGTQYIESDVQKGKDIKESHLRAFRMSKQEILHSWVRLVRQIVYQYFVTTAQIPHLRLLGWLLWAYSRCGVSTGVLIGLCAASLRGLATVSRQLWPFSG